MTLLLGDCLELMKEIPAGSVDLVLCDPPYGTTACKWDNIIPFEPLWEQLHRVCKPNAAMCMFGSEPFSSAMRMSNIKRFKYDWIWNKTQATGHLNAKKQPMRNHEVISVFYSKQARYLPVLTDKDPNNIRRNNSHHTKTDCYGKYDAVGSHSLKNYPTTVIKVANVNRGERVEHPTQKPVALLEYLIKTYTNEGDTVLDPTMGSGSVGVACRNLGRKFIGIEKEPKYFEIANQRISETHERKSQ